MAAQHPGTWAKVLATAGFDETLVKNIGISVERVEEPASAIDERERLLAERLAGYFAPSKKTDHTLLLTERDLSAGNCSWIFGYADRRNGIAVISTCRISDPDNSQNTPARLQKLIAHERGHLQGLAHCSTPGCVMCDTRDAGDLDSSSGRPCGRCPSRFRLHSLIFPIIICALLFLSLDQVGKALKPDRLSPFTVIHAQSEQPAQILFKGKPVLDLPAMPEGLRELETRLNAAYNDMQKARFEIEPAESGSAWIRLNGSDLLEVTAGESGSEPPRALAEKWSRILGTFIDGKGSAAESCPGCHIARHSEVIEWMDLHVRR